jgi:hypothetical protein
VADSRAAIVVPLSAKTTIVTPHASQIAEGFVERRPDPRRLVVGRQDDREAWVAGDRAQSGGALRG